jgi:hypothetical protein
MHIRKMPDAALVSVKEWVASLPCRAKYGEYFGITVAGYPEAHPDVIVSDPEEMDKNYWKDVHYLKEKVRYSFLPPSAEAILPKFARSGLRHKLAAAHGFGACPWHRSAHAGTACNAVADGAAERPCRAHV